MSFVGSEAKVKTIVSLLLCSWKEKKKSEIWGMEGRITKSRQRETALKSLTLHWIWIVYIGGAPVDT